MRGIKEQLGAAAVAAEPLRVMPLQESVTLALNPPTGATVMVAVAELPAATVAGENALAEI